MLLTRAQSCSYRQIGSRHFATCAPSMSAMRCVCCEALGWCTFEARGDQTCLYTESSISSVPHAEPRLSILLVPCTIQHDCCIICAMSAVKIY